MTREPIPTYTTTDLEYSLNNGTNGGGLLDAAAVEVVVAAWGVQGRDWADWTGGFLLRLKDGRFAYLSGWSDSSGWGCQDGADIAYFDSLPEKSSLVGADEYTKPEDYGGWDDYPADLNAWLAALRKGVSE